MTRRGTTTPVLVLALLLLLGGTAGQAQAVGYRYWSFWDLTGGKWTYATQGPSTARPSDGDVQGFRFAVSQDSQDAAKPRGKADLASDPASAFASDLASDFASICAKTPAQHGKKRVALVIDFGTTADAPSGETPPSPRTACARVPSDATTADALASVAKPLRYDANALLCAIAGYPRTGCGDQVSATKPTASARPQAEPAHHGPSVGLLAGVAAVALLGAAAVWQARRRRG
ncbi:SCO2322 family protein [Streptomyces sp. NPDC058255]|uniref:SCO2322 family protein n=1 Tax=Streptomyces sp. NPDC058255 TaxID=3346407 RepID=UPI0036E3DE24